MQERGFTVFYPDLFRGQPWDEQLFGGATGSSPEYEGWRKLHPLERVMQDIASASAFLRAKVAEDAPPGEDSKIEVGICGFCFGGGRMIEALGRGDIEAGVFSAVAFYPTRVDDQVCMWIPQNHYKNKQTK